eukprot:15092213-Alexandrium_andersonii.AAC.1
MRAGVRSQSRRWLLESRLVSSENRPGQRLGRSASAKCGDGSSPNDCCTRLEARSKSSFRRLGSSPF